MKTYEIIGHCNPALSIILDTIKYIEKNDVQIKIVSACNDDFLDKISNLPFNPYLENIEEIDVESWKTEPDCFRIIAAMDHDRRREIFNNIEELFDATIEDFKSLIHPSSYCSITSKIGNGVLISPNSTLAPFSSIGNFTYINRNVSIGHHTVIRDFCSISPGCNVAGQCLIGNNVRIGIGATILDGIRIGENSVVGAGAVVTKDVKSDSIYYGVPAKLIRKKRGEN